MMQSSIEGLEQAFSKASKIARFLKENADDPTEVRRAADDLEALCRYRINVIGSRYETDE